MTLGLVWILVAAEAPGPGALTLTVRDGGQASFGTTGDPDLLWTGPDGLFRVAFADGSRFTAAQATRRSERDGPHTRYIYRHDLADVTLIVNSLEHGFELTATVSGHRSPVTELTLPAHLYFDRDMMTRLIAPANGNNGVGLALLPAFFRRQPPERPTAWEQVRAFDAGYRALFGAGLEMRPDVEPRVPARLGPAAAEYLPEPLRARVAGASILVNRPSTREQVDEVVVDSSNGPWFAASRLGGAGRLWRFGGRVESDDADLATALVAAVVEKLSGDRGKLGLLALRGGPPAGLWAEVRVDAWRAALGSTEAVRSGRLELVELDSAAAMMDALSEAPFAAILNPYGEGIPSPPGGVAEAVAAVGSYVKAGGTWFEAGGYPFFVGLQPAAYLRRDESYPAAFADFLALETPLGAVAVYRVQPRDWEPWAGAHDHRAIFVPGRLAYGGDETGGWLERAYAVHRPPGEPWTAPPVRVQFGANAHELLDAYAAANQIRRPLADKVKPETLERLRQGVLLYYGGNVAEKQSGLERLPAGTLVHFADYLKGGFDKQYPDHLPPAPGFGTQEQMAALFRDAQARGLLVMPYTNPTWWCDGPRGPTFEREGDAPLLRNLDGSLSFEQYAQNTGFTVCHWHPAVQAANRLTVEQFTRLLPVDILFQDQCGARGWRYDTNPASPTVDAYTEGLLSQFGEDSRRVPLSTEGGWDQVARDATQLCGMSWETVSAPFWANGQLLKDRLAPDLWTVYPLAQILAHESCAMTYHDLGQFVTDPHKLSWALGLGFQLSFRTTANALEQPGPAAWFGWLDRLQKSVAARYLGQPVVSFEHVRPAPATTADDGYLRAQYGPVRVVANLGPEPRTVDGAALAPFGFHATAPGLDAGYVGAGEPTAYVVDGGQVWLYSRPGARVEVPWPGGALPAGEGVQSELDGDRLQIQLPMEAAELPAPPAVAPRDRPGPPPRIGVLAFAGWAPTWAQVSPQQWIEALRALPLEVAPLTSWGQLAGALAAGPDAWLGLVNPYGEAFPMRAAGGFREAVEAVRGYVRRGGMWFETGGFSLYQARPLDGSPPEALGPRGLGALGIAVGEGAVEAPPEPLRVTPDGRRWFGAALAEQLERLASPVNRGFPVGPTDPGHLRLIEAAADGEGFLGGYPLGGRGLFWRLGGLHPNPEVAIPAVVAICRHRFESPPEPPPASGSVRLWHLAPR